MSAKTPKKTTTTTSSSSTTSSTTRSSESRRSATPVPQDAQNTGTRFNRVHEKEELANLNDRLACYIDKVRSLETENSRLNREVRTSQETITREVTSVKSMYENELTEARKLLDELATEKAKLEIDTSRIYEENVEYRNNLDKKTKECQMLITNLNVLESRFADVNAKFAQTQQERKKLGDDNKSLEKEKNKLALQVSELKSKLEEETLARVAVENKIQTLREELAFKEQIHQQQISECRTKKQVEISEIDGRLTQEYEEKLYQSLQEIREQYEIDLENNKDEIKNMYEEKIQSLTNHLSRNTCSAQRAIDEMRNAQKRVDDLNNRLNDLEAEKNFLLQKIRDLERQLEGSNAQYMEEISKYNSEISRLREEMAGHAKEYQDLMDTKVALDLEISAYRKLLEQEEERLHITPVTSPRSTPRNSGRRIKRKREYFESEESSSSDVKVTNTASGDIEISDVCVDGSFVKIYNKGNKEVAIGGWQIIRKAGDNSTAFKFHRSVKVEPGATVTVWSSDCSQRHEPPDNIIMKGQKWVVSNKMSTTIINSEHDEVAVRILEKQQGSHKISERRLGGYYTPSGPSSRLGEKTGEEKCSIM